MSLLEILIALREHLLRVSAENNRQEAEQLFGALVVLREISYMNPNQDITEVIVDLLEATRDVAMGASWKSTIPSIEQLQAAFSEAP